MEKEGTKQFQYYAFISYKREDEKWAKWLQKKLESYGFPVALRKDNPTLPKKIYPIFRDQSELSGGNLKEEIEKGLAGSKYLVVICSPRAAQSPWVSKEVQYFIDNGKEESIIPFIIGGIPNSRTPEDECFPEGLRQLSGEKEILGININEMGRDAAAIKVIARMFGIRFDTLWQRHERAKRRRTFGMIRYLENKREYKVSDSIDIQCKIEPIPFDDMANETPAEPSASIRERVIKARAIQTLRFKAEKGIYCNAQMNSRLIHAYAWSDEEGLAKLKDRMTKLNMSARALDRASWGKTF